MSRVVLLNVGQAREFLVLFVQFLNQIFSLSRKLFFSLSHKTKIFNKQNWFFSHKKMFMTKLQRFCASNL